MKQGAYWKVMVAVASFVGLLSGCNDYFKPDRVETEAFRVMLSGQPSRSIFDESVIKQMQIYSFQKLGTSVGQGISPFSHIVQGLTYNNGGLETKAMRVGDWDIAMVAAQGATFTPPVVATQAGKGLMYTFDSKQNEGQAHEFYYGYHRLPTIEADKDYVTVNAGLARNVAMVRVVVDRAVGLDLSGTDHKITLDGIPTLISWAGTLLKKVDGGSYQTDMANFDVLPGGIERSVKFKVTATPGISASDTIDFIIPAHRGEDFWTTDGKLNPSPTDTIRKKMTLTVNFKRASEGRFTVKAEIPLVARCNQILLVKARMQDVNVEINSSVEPWTTQGISGNNEWGALNVSHTDVSVYDGAVTRVHFWSDQPKDSIYITKAGGDGVSNVDAIFDRISGHDADNKFYDPRTKSGYIDIANLFMDSNPAEVKIYLNASGDRREIKVRRVISPFAQKKITTPYVGTFHRWFETGERVITWPHEGPWTASIDDPSGTGADVVIDRFAGNAFLDGSMYGTSPSSAEGNKVTGSAGSVSGVNRIYFRVGWKTPLGSATDDPRYATITVRSDKQGKIVKLYLRQGEKPSVLYDRTGAVRFSPYNLASVKPNVSLPFEGGFFAEYPSQCGAYFQWMEPTNIRFSYAPSGSVFGTWYSKPPVFEAYWTEVLQGSPMLANLYETCPPGYRRANDGATDGEPTGQSEMRQTLWKDPTITNAKPENTQSGYYADGFFDRYEIKASANNIGNSAAGIGNQVAYRGTLFFNDSNNASLFFPAAGQRSVDNGALLDTGSKGYYWTSTSTVAAEGGAGKAAGAHLTPIARNRGVTIRCVTK